MRRQMRVLIVDPDDQDRQSVARVLAESALPGEFEVVTVSGTSGAMAEFRSAHPDLILISTSDFSGVGREIARAVRESEGLRHTGIIFINHQSRDDSTLSVECLEMGADDFLRHGCTSQELMARVRAVLRLKAMTDELRSANHRLRVLSMTDELTGLANMRSFNQRFGDVLRRARRGDIGVGVMMLDLDRFKSVNDSTNHLIGSFVISEVGRLLRQEGFLSEGDVAARYGGDEFIVACEAASLDEAYQRAETIRRQIAASCFERDGCAIRITSSIGVSWADRKFEGRGEDLIKAADLMLYRSKNLGRNRVSGMVLKYPLDLDHESASRLSKRITLTEELGGTPDPEDPDAEIIDLPGTVYKS